MPHIAMPRLSITVHLHGSNSYCGQAQIAFPMPRTQRSSEAERYNRLYHTQRWLDLRQAILVRDRYTCADCKKLIIGKGEAHVDHEVPHKGDLAKFWDPSNLRVLCRRCHAGAKQKADRRGYSSEIGSDGFPVDPSHPANRF